MVAIWTIVTAMLLGCDMPATTATQKRHDHLLILGQKVFFKRIFELLQVSGLLVS